jgi:hypothetical protein
LPRISNKATTQTDLIAPHSVQDGGLRLRFNPPYGLRHQTEGHHHAKNPKRRHRLLPDENEFNLNGSGF